MNGIARKTSDSAGGAQLNGGQGFARVGGDLVVLLGDPVAGHGLSPHAAPVMVQGSTFARINGVPICREGHLASCGHVTTGSGFARLSN